MRGASRNWYLKNRGFTENRHMKPKMRVFEKLVPKFRVFGTQVSRNWYFGVSGKQRRQAI